MLSCDKACQTPPLLISLFTSVTSQVSLRLVDTRDLDPVGNVRTHIMEKVAAKTTNTIQN